MKESVCAIVVTHNRPKLLLECIDGLKKQTYTLDAIYIIDNASNIDIFSLLKEKGYIDEKTHYIRLAKNIGGAGGFNEGMKRAYKDGYDWFWLMDDDVVPVKDGLEKMLKYSTISKCIHPSKRYSNGNRIVFEGYLDLRFPKTVFYKDDISFNNKKDFTFINYGCFEGMLIHRNIVKKIGFPDKRFFITWDDTIYGFLASLYTCNIYIKDVVIIKKLKQERLSKLSTYHYIKNHFIVFEYLKKFGTFNCWSYIFLLLKSIRMSIGCIIYDLDFKKLLLIWKGFFDGLFKRYTN